MNLSPPSRRILPSDKTIGAQPAPATAAAPVDEESGASLLTTWRSPRERGKLAVNAKAASLSSPFALAYLTKPTSTCRVSPGPLHPPFRASSSTFSIRGGWGSRAGRRSYRSVDTRIAIEWPPKPSHYVWPQPVRYVGVRRPLPTALSRDGGTGLVADGVHSPPEEGACHSRAGFGYDALVGEAVGRGDFRIDPSQFRATIAAAVGRVEGEG
jgi:hypothetical protein